MAAQEKPFSAASGHPEINRVTSPEALGYHPGERKDFLKFMRTILAKEYNNVYNNPMLQSKPSKKTSFAGTIVAIVCIMVYLIALVNVVIRVSKGMDERRFEFDQELGFLYLRATDIIGAYTSIDESFQLEIQNFVNSSKTLEGVIIIGPIGEYPFEKKRAENEANKARIIEMVNGSPRFIKNFAQQQEYRILFNLKNSSIEAVYNVFDYEDLTGVLIQAMLLIAAALALAFFTLIIGSVKKKKEAGTADGKGRGDAGGPAENAAKPQYAGGSYSNRGRVTREENTEIRLTEELQRCAASAQDLGFISMKLKFPVDDEFYARFAADAARFFSSRDFVCEKGDRGISIICPGLTLESAFLNADEFHNRVMGKYPDMFKVKTDLCVGISARSGRPINAERLIFETEEALERALMEPVSHIVAFKSDPEKYREFMESRGQ